jgi:hypothetical protein
MIIFTIFIQTGEKPKATHILDEETKASLFAVSRYTN